MDILKSIHELPTTEKIKVMEFLWEDLTIEEHRYSSPKWHETKLRETEVRFTQGSELSIDWSEAKQLLKTE